MHGKAFVDGGARGNPGPAGAAGIVEAAHGHGFSINKYLGETTNNVAEYSALILMLEKAIHKGFTELDIYADSELMVRQIKGVYKVKDSKLKGLYLEAIKYLQQLKKYTITHIKREYNQEADKLVNEVIDNELAGN